MSDPHSPSFDSKGAGETSLDDRRNDQRLPSSASLRLQLDGQSVEGIAENVSQAGALFFSSDSLRVSVEIVENGETRTLTGRIARIERMSAENSGYAVEFDPS